MVIEALIPSQRSLEVRPTPTTTLLVEKPTHFDQLQAKYKVIRYELPRDLRWKKIPYGQVHNALRDQLNCPYRSYQHDQLDGVEKWVVYALYPRETSPVSLIMSFCSQSPVPFREIEFHCLELHELLKLLHVAYVHGGGGNRFIGQDKCYVYAKKVGKTGHKHLCLEIELSGCIENQPRDSEQEFHVVGHARFFRKMEYPKSSSPSYAYFARHISHNTNYFLHLKRNEIVESQARKDPVYGISTSKEHHATLAYHDLLQIEASGGKLLFDFLRDFSAYLAKLGIMSCQKERRFQQFLPPKNEIVLPVTQLNPIAVFDHRLNKRHPLDAYLALFRRWRPDLQFVELTDMACAEHRAVLILQDCSKEDFDSEGLLSELTDAYPLLYRQYRAIPKQSLNVNMIQEKDHLDRDDYLAYEMIEDSNDEFKMRFEVALAQLYMKDVVCSSQPFQERLPYFPEHCLFLRKGRYATGLPPFETLLYMEQGKLHFVAMQSPEQWDFLIARCEQLGVDWDEMEDRLLRKYRKRHDNEDDKELSHYDLIIGPGFFVELEDINERVLYDYDTIIERQQSVRLEMPIEQFKLLPYYDEVRSENTHLSLEQLEHRGLLNGKSPTTKTEIASLSFYRQLEAYDAFLDELGLDVPEISYQRLTDDPWKGNIARIFDIHPDKNGKVSCRLLKSYYQKRKWFRSDKAKDVHMYEGIWFDEEQCYMVGSAQPLNQKQPRAHLIRRFDIYQGADAFDIQSFLLTMSVQFVRYHQYTVYPYPFHLIDLYVENVLRYL